MPHPRPTYRAHHRSAQLFDLVATPHAVGVWLVVYVNPEGDQVKIRGERRAYIWERVEGLKYLRASSSSDRKHFLIAEEVTLYGGALREEVHLREGRLRP